MKICKFCGHLYDEDIQRLRHPRPPITQRAEDIIERRPPAYKILTYDLSKPRINEPQNFSADTISVIETIPADLQFTIRINHHENDEIPMKLGRSIAIPFVRFFLTTPKYPNGRLKLLVGGELGEFKYQAPDTSQIIIHPEILALHNVRFCEGFMPMREILFGRHGIWWIEVIGIKKLYIKEIWLVEGRAVRGQSREKRGGLFEVYWNYYHKTGLPAIERSENFYKIGGFGVESAPAPEPAPAPGDDDEPAPAEVPGPDPRKEFIPYFTLNYGSAIADPPEFENFGGEPAWLDPEGKLKWKVERYLFEGTFVYGFKTQQITEIGGAFITVGVLGYEF